MWNDSQLVCVNFKDYNNEQYVLFSKIVNGYLTAFLVVCGSFGNAYGVRRVHLSNLDKNRCVVLAVSLIALAFWDIILLWSALVYYGLKNFDTVNIDQLNRTIPFFHGLSQVANASSIWCVAYISFQRFRATKNPFKFGNSRNGITQSFRSERRLSFFYFSAYRRLFKIPIVISVGALAFNALAFFEVEVHKCHRNNTLVAEGYEIGTRLLLSNLRMNEVYRVYRVVSRIFLISIGPNVFILFITLATLYTLKGTNRSRLALFQTNEFHLERHTQRQRENIQNTVSIMLVTKFLLFRSLTFALDIMEITKGIDNYYLVDVSNILVILNSSTNCIIFLKAGHWLNNKFAERHTMRRKRTVCDASLLLGERLKVVQSTWQNAMQMTNGQLGLRVLYSMLRKYPQLFNVFREDEKSNEKVFHCPIEPELITLLGNNGTRRSFDIITNTKYQEVADRITSFITEIIEMMIQEQTEQVIIMRIRRVGAVHYHMNIHFPSCVWKEFKSSTIDIISETEFHSEADRQCALEAWNIFISFLIREMKMGTWAIDECINGNNIP